MSLSPPKKTMKEEKVETSCTDVLDLEEVIELVFLYLNYNTLCTVQHVCKLWQKKAHQRLLKNNPPFFTFLPNIFMRNDQLFFSNHRDVVANEPILKDIVYAVPEKVVILFCPIIMKKAYIESYLKFLPHESTAVNEFIYVDGACLNTTNYILAAVIFPKIPSIEIRSSIVVQSTMDKYLNSADAFAELFDSNSKEKGNCLIILGTNLSCNPDKPECSEKKFISELLDYLKNMNNTLQLTIWGGTSTTLFHRDIHLNKESIHWHILNIIGIDSYSIVLNFDLNEELFKQRLMDFKNTIALKQDSFALAIAHTSHLDSNTRDEIMKKVLRFEEIFKIKLTIILSRFDGNVHCDPIIFCNASDNANLKIENKNLNTVAYLIISN